MSVSGQGTKFVRNECYQNVRHTASSGVAERSTYQQATPGISGTTSVREYPFRYLTAPYC